MLELVAGGWHRCDPTWSSARSSEPYTKIYVPQRGAGWYDCGAERHALTPGKLYLIPGDRIHAYHCADVLELWWVHLRPLDPHLRRLLSSLTDLVTFTQADRQPEWEKLTHHFSNRPLSSTLALHGWALGLLSELPPSQDQSERRLDAVRSWIEKHALRNPSLAEMARQAALSPSQFTRLAQREWRESPHALVLRLRIQGARDLLAGSDLTVAAVANRTGFADAPSLTKAFRRHVGQPPDAWRRAVKP
jgi:AraC-like DNA-binding protein